MASDVFLYSPAASGHGQLIGMKAAPFEAETILQQLLADHPQLLTDGTFGEREPRRWMLVRREQGVPGETDGSDIWSLDHLYLDQDAVPTLVEVKRASDSRIRREVVAQMLDYAANAVAHWRVEDMRKAVSEQMVVELLGREDADPEEYWQQAEANLRAGRIRLLFVADELPPSLVRIIEFLNEQMRPATVVGIEIRHYVNGAQRLLVPRVIGQTAKAQATKATTTPAEVMSEEAWRGRYAQEHGSDAAQLLDEMVTWFRSKADECNLTKRQESYFVRIDRDGRSYYPLTLARNGTIYPCLAYLKSSPGFTEDSKRQEIYDRFASLPGIKLSTKNIAGYPAFPILALTAPQAKDAFKKASEWLISSIRTGAL